jgi:DNA replication protein DnaC
MLTQPTIEKLYTLRLGAMAAAFQEQQKDAKTTNLSFDERFAMLVDSEHLARDNRRIKTLLKDAELRIPSACLEDVEGSAARGIDKAMLRQFSSGAWIDQNLNALITGATGVGKSYLACALGQNACRRGLRVLYRRMPRPFDELTLAKADGTYAKLLRKLARAQLLILDDLGLGSPSDAQRHDLLEVLEDRYGSRATVVTSNQH